MVTPEDQRKYTIFSFLSLIEVIHMHYIYLYQNCINWIILPNHNKCTTYVHVVKDEYFFLWPYQHVEVVSKVHS